MAGSFGYEAAHYDVSMRMAELSLLPAVRAAGEDTLIVADGTSCRHQIADGTRATERARGDARGARARGCARLNRARPVRKPAQGELQLRCGCRRARGTFPRYSIVICLRS